MPSVFEWWLQVKAGDPGAASAVSGRSGKFDVPVALQDENPAGPHPQRAANLFIAWYEGNAIPMAFDRSFTAVSTSGRS